MFKKKYIMYCPVCGYVDGEHAKTVCPFFDTPHGSRQGILSS